MLNISNYQLHLKNIIAAYFLKNTFHLWVMHGVIIMDKNFLDLKRKITIGYCKIMQALG